MSEFIRGNTLTISCIFKPRPGQVGTPSSASVRVVYTNTSGAKATNDILMTLGTDGVTWTATWDSTLSKGGSVQWWARCQGGLVAATQGSFDLDANDANT